MYLVLGDPDHPVGSRVATMLATSGYEVTVVPNIVSEPIQFSWWLNVDNSKSEFFLQDRSRIHSDEVQGVFVCSPGAVGQSRLRAQDLVFFYWETRATLLAWLWSLECPVINRYSPAAWFRGNPPLQFWGAALTQSGLSFVDCLFTNVEEDLERFRNLGKDFFYAPLTSGKRFRMSTNEHWRQLITSPCRLPVHLMVEPTESYSACLVGGCAVWNGQPFEGHGKLESAMRLFGALSGLSFVEIAFAVNGSEARVIAIYPEPRLHLFDNASRERVLTKLVRELELQTHFPTSCRLHRRR